MVTGKLSTGHEDPSVDFYTSISPAAIQLQAGTAPLQHGPQGVMSLGTDTSCNKGT
jgi:hypothetical protein